MCETLATTYKHALLSLIFRSSSAYINEGNLKPYPSDWEDETNDGCANNNKFAAWIDEYFETGDDFSISKKGLENELRCHNLGNTNIKDELKRMRIKFKYDCHKKLRGNTGVYYEFSFIPEETQREVSRHAVSRV